MKTTRILLSTYNGEQFIGPLLGSLLSQTYQAFTVLVRDDGSRDATVRLIDRFAADSRVRVITGEHVGPAESYFALLDRAEPGGYFAFCDQDDIWLPDKLRRAAAWLDAQPDHTPALYCSRLILVDAALARVGLSPPQPRGPSFNNALVENIAAGCTTVFNDAARGLLANRRPCAGVMHDSWAYLVASAFGRVRFDPEPGILYRQHGNNVVGAERGSWRAWRDRIGRVRRRDYQSAMLRQAAEFERLFGGDLDPAKAQLLRRFIEHPHTWRRSLNYAWRPDVWRQTAIDNAAMRLMVGLRAF